jgi:predicted aspartyl protease
MGKVMTPIRLTNSHDRQRALDGELDAASVRTIELEALVDTGATMLVIPSDAALLLGVPFEGTRNVRMANGERHAIPWIAGLRLELCGREMTCDALVMPTGTTALIGQIPLEALDLIVDPKNREVRVNPESPESPLLDLLACA